MLFTHASLFFWALAMLKCPPMTCPHPADKLWAAVSAQEMNFTVEGKITRLGQNKFDLNSEENMVFHVRYDAKTEIKREDGNTATAKDLRVGSKVRVDGDLTESGEIVARRIVIQSSEPANKPSPSH